MGVSGGEYGARHGPSLMPGTKWELYVRARVCVCVCVCVCVLVILVWVGGDRYVDYLVVNAI